MITKEGWMEHFAPTVTDKVMVTAHNIQQIMNDAFTAGQAQGRHDGMTEAAEICKEKLKSHLGIVSAETAIKDCYYSIIQLRDNPKKETV